MNPPFSSARGQKNELPQPPVLLRAAQDLAGVRSGSVGHLTAQGRVRLQLPDKAPVVLPCFAEKSAPAMRHQLLQVMPRPARHQRDRPCQHRLHHRPAPAFIHAGRQLVNKEVQRLEKPAARHRARLQQLPPVVELMLRPQPRHLLAPAHHPEAPVFQPQPLVGFREILRKLRRVRPRETPRHQRSPRLSAAPPVHEGEVLRIDVISRHHPPQLGPAGVAGGKGPALPARVRQLVRRDAGFHRPRLPVGRLQRPALRLRDVDDRVDQPQRDQPPLTGKEQHHVIRPREFQPPPPQIRHPARGQEKPVAVRHTPALQPLRQVPPARHPDAHPAHLPHPLLLIQTVVLICHHRDVIPAPQQPEGVPQLRIRPAQMGRPAKKVKFHAGVRQPHASGLLH